jgi:hypothetical protein
VLGAAAVFEFYPPDHSVVRGVYDYGCIPYEMIGENQVGFYSGQKKFNVIPDPVSDPIERRSLPQRTSQSKLHLCG